MKKIVCIPIFLIVLFFSSAFASNVEGTKTYEDYLFILVHGINGGSHHFNGQDGRDKGLRLKQALENDLGLKGYVYSYSFQNKNGSSWRIKEQSSVQEIAVRLKYEV